MSDYYTIPAEMKFRPQWMVYKLVAKVPPDPRGKMDKPPYDVRSGHKADATDPAHWCPYADALGAAQSGRYDGLAYAFSEDDPYTGVDLDGCRNRVTGEVEVWAQDIVRRLDSYTEVSPSGRGLHVVVKAKLPQGGRKRGDVEMYDARHLFTMTGTHVVGTPVTVNERQAEIDALHAEVFGSQPEPTTERATAQPDYSEPIHNDTLSDDVVLQLATTAKNGAKVAALFAGNTAGYPSASEADYALIGAFAFYTQDADQIERLMQRSGLSREKWKKRNGQYASTLRRHIETLLDKDRAAERDSYIPGRNGYHPDPDPGLDGSLDELQARTVPGGSPEPTAAPDRTVESFPLDTLPAGIRAFVRTVAAAIHCPTDYVAMPLLVYASAAIGNSACLEIKKGWREYARFWLAIVGDPGDKKSPAIGAVHRAIEDRQKANHVAWEAERQRWEDNGREGSEPKLAQLYTSDATIEALGDLMHDNSRGIVVTRDELSGWALAMNEYKRRGADRQHWLALWSGAALMVNRRSRSRALYVEHPFVSVVGGIQPDVLGELCDERGRNDGFVHRLLFVYPDRKRRTWTDAEIADEVYKPVATLFDKLYERGAGEPLVVTFTTTARDLWRESANALYAEAEARDFPDALRGPWAKLEGYTARLALVVHLMRAAFDATIDAQRCDETSLRAAVDLAEYLKSHLRRVYARLLARPDDIRLLRVVGWIRDHGRKCTARELYRAGVAGIRTAAEAEATLTDIVNRGWGKTEETQNAHGPKTLCFTLHNPPVDSTTGGEK